MSIYKIEPICEHEEGEVYIGSTTKTLNKRFSYHKSDYKKYKTWKYDFVTIYTLFEKYGIQNCRIVLLEIVNCNSKDELIAREGHYIRTLKCINKVIPDRQIKEYNKKYYEENKEKLNEQNKIYREENKEKISERKKIKFICECGIESRINDKVRHNRSKRHIDFITSTINVSP